MSVTPVSPGLLGGRGGASGRSRQTGGALCLIHRSGSAVQVRGQDLLVTVPTSRADRRRQRRPRVEELLGDNADAALDILELTEFAWHDCYGDVTPPDTVVDDILVCSRGRLADLAHAARMAVEDYRDLRMQADHLR